MPWWGWILIAAGVVLVLCVAFGLVLAQRLKTRHLQQRFGPEYDRVTGSTGSTRAAEAELAEREARRERIEIRDLPETSRARYVDEWRALQSDFVDEPERAVGSADALLQRVMAERGYPVEDFEQRADDLSVDYPEVVQNYREGHRLAQMSAGNGQSTEALRQAMRHYRALFEELVERTPVTTEERGR
jgi:hypothetical protein